LFDDGVAPEKRTAESIDGGHQSFALMLATHRANAQQQNSWN
jgi:hypothetical protein